MNFINFKNSFLLILSVVTTVAMSAAPSFSLYDLTCEQAANPVGVENRHPCFSWKTQSERSGYLQVAYQLLVAESEADLSKDDGTVWNSERVASGQSVLVPFAGGELKSGKQYFWKVRTWSNTGEASEWSEVQTFAMGLLKVEDWGASQWIALEKDKPEDYCVPGLHGTNAGKKKYGDRKIGMYRLPQFRKQFAVQKRVKRAVAYIAGLGHFDLFLNGDKVGNHFLDAGWTKYDKQALYVSFDVTKQLAEGDNTIGVMLGNGFYNVPFERYIKVLISHGAPKMKMLLRLEYVDGTTQEIVSDNTWKTTESPITFSSIYGGEAYDATRETTGWKQNGFNDSRWQKALIVDYRGMLTSQQSTPLTVHSEIPAVTITKTRKGYWLYDLGQNFSGIIKIKVRSNDSKEIVFRPAELLNPDSTVNQSASGDPFYFSYKTKGDRGEEQWQPQFTYYGFRYVQVEGAVPAGTDNPEHLPEITLLEGLHTCNSAPEAGSFYCSKPMFNQIHNLIDWAIRSNLASVETDCPHREKLGWLEEAHLMQGSLQYRYNLSRLYGKTVNDMQVSQRTDGCIPTIAPEYVRFENFFEDTPEWGSAFIISPWYIYKWYGDRRLIEQYYPYMQKYIDYLTSRADNHIVAYGLGDWFDIGPGSPGNAQLTSNAVTATAVYYYDVSIMQQIASLIGKTEDAAHYKLLGEQIKAAFLEKFYDKTTHKIERNSQTASAMPLYVGLIDEAAREAVLQNLVDDIRGRNNALTAGDVGYSYVVRTLLENGRSDVLFDMNSKYDVPGYGWQLAHGATALTESWQAYGFVSNNHFMLGHLMEWFYAGLGGIRQQPESIGFDKILIDPQAVGDVNGATTTYESPYGQIATRWERTDEYYKLNVTIPANTTAKIALPTTDEKAVTNFGMPLQKLSLKTEKSSDGTKMFVNVGSGTYQFEVKHIGK